MSSLFGITIPVVLTASLVLLFVPAGYAQSADADADETQTGTAPEQEVEVNEDNYRQFMELKDALQQRNVPPQNSYQSQSGMQ